MRRRAFALAGLLLVLAPAAALGRPRLHAVGPATTGVLATDGSLLAYSTSQTTVRVIDRHFAQVARVTGSSSCDWKDFGAGSLLASCYEPSAGYSGALYDLRTKAFAPLPAAPGSGDLGDDQTLWMAVGRSWLQGYYSGYHYFGTTFQSRTTGEVRTTTTLDNDHQIVADLDRPDLWRPMCRPLHAGDAVETTTTDYKARGPYVYAPPYGAGFAQHVTPKGSGLGRIIFGRCGQRQRTLARCRSAFCTPPILTDHAVAWMDGSSLVVYLIDRHVFWRWPDAVWGYTAKGPVAIGRRLFFTKGISPDQYSTNATTLYTLLLPPVRK